MTTTYELRVAGHLDRHWTSYLGGLTLCHDSDGTSTLTGQLVDQPALHGVLAGLRDLGVSLLSVRALPLGDQALADQPAVDQPAADEDVRGPLTRLGWPKHTERLALRPARPEDAEPTWRFRRLEPVSRWLTEAPTSLESYRATFAKPTRLARTLVVELDDEVVGDLMLRVEDAWAQKEVAAHARGTQAEVAWVLAPDLWGTGCATEAATELVRICFDEVGVRRVVAVCFADNESSWRLMERLGMRRELHAVAAALHRTGGWADTYGYAVTAGDWARSPLRCRSTDPRPARGGPSS